MSTFKFSFKRVKIDWTDKPLYLSEKYLCNGHWLVSIDWLLTLDKRARYMLKALEETKFHYGLARLKGEERKKGPDLDSVVPSEDKIAKVYDRLTISPESVQPIIREKKGEQVIEAVALAFKQRRLLEETSDAIRISAEYYSILLFDPEIEVYGDTNAVPIVLRKNNQTVGVIMPMRK